MEQCGNQKEDFRQSGCQRVDKTTVKRQFMQVQPPQSNDAPAQQAWMSPEQPAIDERPGVVPAQFPAKVMSLAPQQPGPHGGGLLSRWKTGAIEPPATHFARPGAIQQDIATLSPATGETYSASYAPSFATQLAPNESGITPLSPLYANTQAPHRPAAQPLSPPVMTRPVQPPHYAQPLQPLFPQPMPGQAPMPGMPRATLPSSPHIPTAAPTLPFAQRQTQQGTGQRGRKKRRLPMWARIVLSVFLLFLLAVGSVAGYYYYTLSSTLSGTVGQQVNRLKGDNNPNITNNGGDSILSGKRINILLLGSDTDQKFAADAYLAQTDIVVTIDPKTKNVGMLSIPRDTWLNVPDHGMLKLDEAFSYGGVALSRATIHQDFGIYIDYYAWVGLDGFIKVIDTVGGVDVDVLHPIVDDNYPDDIGNHGNDIFALKRLYLAPGPQHLSGPQALEYVRSRHADLMGDFGRSTRQQQVLTQLKTKLSTPAIIGKAQDLANDLKGYVKTDMQLNQVLELMNFARTLDQNKIKRVTLGTPYSSLMDEKTADGTKAVVILDCNKVQALIAQMFDLGNNARCNTQAQSDNAPALASFQTRTPPGVPHRGALGFAPTLGTGGTSDLFGVHSLLDLLFLVVFESPLAMQV